MTRRKGVHRLADLAAVKPGVGAPPDRRPFPECPHGRGEFMTAWVAALARQYRLYQGRGELPSSRKSLLPAPWVAGVDPQYEARHHVPHLLHRERSASTCASICITFYPDRTDATTRLPATPVVFPTTRARLPGNGLGQEHDIEHEEPEREMHPPGRRLLLAPPVGDEQAGGGLVHDLGEEDGQELRVL